MMNMEKLTLPFIFYNLEWLFVNLERHFVNLERDSVNLEQHSVNLEGNNINLNGHTKEYFKKSFVIIFKVVLGICSLTLSKLKY